MAGGIARAAAGGGGSGLGSMFKKLTLAAGQGGIDDGSTAGVAPAPIAGVPADPSGVDQFAGKKFEISPVQMKGSFSSKTRENAEGVYGDEDERSNSLKR
tara:strand:+ start:188 stop:487 length:300 start_codon:yes stop_codon:yes gene_type:complete